MLTCEIVRRRLFGHNLLNNQQSETARNQFKIKIDFFKQLDDTEFEICIKIKKIFRIKIQSPKWNKYLLYYINTISQYVIIYSVIEIDIEYIDINNGRYGKKSIESTIGADDKIRLITPLVATDTFVIVLLLLQRTQTHQYVFNCIDFSSQCEWWTYKLWVK